MPVTTATDNEQEAQADLKREALKVLIGEHRDQFVPVRVNGRQSLYRIDNATYG